MDINYTKILFTALLILSFSTSTAFALSNNEEEKLFEIKTTSINRVQAKNETRFDFSPVNIFDKSNIGHWKVRIYCDKQAVVRFEDSKKNNCGQAVRIENQDIENFYLYFKNSSKKPAGFYFKLRAYDLNGKWLHSERAGFRWK